MTPSGASALKAAHAREEDLISAILGGPDGAAIVECTARLRGFFVAASAAGHDITVAWGYRSEHQRVEGRRDLDFVATRITPAG